MIPALRPCIPLCPNINIPLCPNFPYITWLYILKKFVFFIVIIVIIIVSFIIIGLILVYPFVPQFGNSRYYYSQKLEDAGPLKFVPVPGPIGPPVSRKTFFS